MKIISIMDNFPCTCGHAKVKHIDQTNPAIEPIDIGCCVSCYNLFGEDASFHKFQGDNLRYLENLIE